MKKKIAILGSTGSIGKTTFNIIKKYKNEFEVILLTTNKNTNELLDQVNKIKVKNIIVSDKSSYSIIKKKLKNKNINVYNNLNNLNKIVKIKVDYTMCGISGLAGLKPTLDSIKFSKKIGLANKESIICGWNLIKKQLDINKTKFIPIDSEHFSIWSLINNHSEKSIEKIIITASGGPFFNLPLNKFKKIKPKSALKHPRWKMGKKISIDSATMMNKVFEIIEAKRIFNLDINKFKILIHPKSYVHAIVKFNNGITKLLIHDTDMKIPIFNSIFNKSQKMLNTSNLKLQILNNLNFNEINERKFPSINILKMIPKKISLYETVLVSANDELVDLFLKRKIKFIEIVKFLKKIMKMKYFTKYKNKIPNNYNDLIKLSNFVRLKTKLLCIRYHND